MISDISRTDKIDYILRQQELNPRKELVVNPPRNACVEAIILKYREEIIAK